MIIQGLRMNVMREKQMMGALESIVLMGVIRLDENAYGVTIQKAVEEAMEKAVSLGSIYAALERLEDKGYVTSVLGEPTQERGGRAKRFFKVEGAGVQALNDFQRAQTRLLEGVNWKRLGLTPLGG